MSYVLTAPEMVATAATDVSGIRSAISTANAAAAAPISGVLAAAGDEVSTAIAKLFSAYGLEYQAVVEQAAALHADFNAALAAAASAYAEAEAASAALVSRGSTELGALNAPIRALLGSTPAGTGSSGALASMMKLASVDPLTALIMGGTDNPLPDPAYVTAINNAYIQPRFPGAVPQGLFTPEEFWPITGTLTFGQSVAQGVTLLNSEIDHQINTLGNSVVVFGYSQSATIATNEINALMAAGSPYTGQLSFVLASNPNNPDGGILARFPGFYIPFLDVPFSGATPPNSPYPTSMYTIQYEGVANAPQYPLHVLSNINAVMGYFYLHDTYQHLTATQVSSALPLPTSPGYTGNTQYYMLLTQNLPLVQPIRDIPYLGPPLADLIQPDLRVLVDLGYGNIGVGADYANVPTPARLIQLIDPFSVGFNLAKGAVQGPQAALVDIGLLPPSYLPDTYPYVPSLNPGLSLSFGQPSVTGLSVLSCTLGSILHLIPPVNP
ncbi:PE family protein [Mycobacterium ostraviense]|uniref:PE family protein n=1 Tax=Mycobacterium ostraviense TaxID=2738409 RepID=A0A163X4Y2_9MYCO|nr:PE-PPE domain-containing protein [Mycobacterium ostraviense]KZS58985.1 PE family protein [Mycobacterium ostraviense]UGT91216.1 PE-PPE domain-containing protein [Mycobacterium ostraviense]